MRLLAKIICFWILCPSISIAQNNKLYFPQKIDSLNTLAKKLTSSNLDKSLSLAKNALQKSLEQKYEKGRSSALNNLGNYFAYKGSYKEALTKYLECVQISKKNNFPIVEANALSNIGNIHYFMENSEKAITYNQKALNIFHKEEKPQKIANCYKNIGNIYFHGNKYDSSLTFYKKAMWLYKEIKDTSGAAGVYHNMALIHHNQKNLKKAENYYNKSLKYYHQLGNIRGIGLVNINLGNFYLQKKNFQQCRIHLNEASKKIKKSGMKEWETDIYQLKSKLNQEEGNFKKALLFYKNFHTLNDSLRNEKRVEKINELQTKYETTQIKKENQLNQVKLNKRKTIISILIISAGILIITILGLIYLSNQLKNNIRKVKKQNKIIRKQHNLIIHEKEKLFKQEMKEKQKELTSNAIFLARANEKNKKLINDLNEFISDDANLRINKLKSLINSYKVAYSDNNLKEFEIQFNKLHTDFYTKLSEKFPQLTPKEKKLCALLKLNMTSKEISSITLAGENSINVARSRLRDKLELSRDENLINFLSSF